MTEYDKKAAHLQSMGRNGERETVQPYEPAQVSQAVVHTREDIVLLVSYASSANDQLRDIRYWLGFIAALLFAILIVIFLRK